MAWTIDKVRPRIEWHRRRPVLVRYEWSWYQSAYGAGGGVARTKRQAEQRLARFQASMWAEDYRP